MDPNVVFLAVAVLAFAAVGGAGFVLAGGGAASDARTAKRVQALAGGPARGERGVRTAKPAGEAAALRRKQMLANLKAVERQERKAKLTVEGRIQQAGLSWSVRNFWIGRVVVGLLFGVVALVVGRNPLIGLGVAFVAGFGLPLWLLGMIKKKRHKAFTEEFPNAIDIIVRGIKSGLPVSDCLKVIAAESPDPCGMEFRKLVENLGMGLALDQAMDKMYARMSVSEVRFFAIVLAIQQRSGGNLAEALGNLSAVLRARKLMREKIKAMSGEAVASAAIIGILPPGVMLLVTVTSPDYMTPLFTTSTGHLALLIGAAMMSFGIFVMRRMINFKI